MDSEMRFDAVICLTERGALEKSIPECTPGSFGFLRLFPRIGPGIELLPAQQGSLPPSPKRLAFVQPLSGFPTGL